MNRPYDTGLLVGRFQTFHKGHQSLLDTALQLCDRVLVLVGSAQEVGTLRNPFGIARRIEMIREIYPDKSRVLIHALPDLTHENDITPDWGRFVLKNVEQYIHKSPELMIYGNDEARSRWFDVNDIKDTSEFIVPRNRLEISGTQLRELMIQGNRKEWFKLVDQKLHKMYDELYGELISIEEYSHSVTQL